MEKYITVKSNFALLIACLLMMFLSTCNSCSSKSEMTRVKKELVKTQEKLDSLNSNIFTKSELSIKLEIEGLKTSKRMLYDQNAIVRTTVRPDDRMNEYDTQIKELEKTIK